MRRRVSPRLGLALAVAAGALPSLGCGGDDEAGEVTTVMNLGTTGPADGTSTGEVEPPTQEGSDLCALAPIVGAGTHYGSLRAHAVSLGGACGEGGPDAFFRLEVPRRSDVQLRGLGSGFSPRVGVLPHACVDEWDTRQLHCDHGAGTWLLDVAAGSSLVVAVGIDGDHPILGLPPPTAGPDPLSFSLEVKLRNVLEIGDACEPEGRGRCTSGAACLPTPPPEDDPQGQPGPAVCTAIEADTCDSAVSLELAEGSNWVEIDPVTLHTDAHAHSCGGARQRERVLRLVMPGSGPYGLEVRGDRPELGFAIRSPGCGPAEERACVKADPSVPTAITTEIAESTAMLFVELPDDDEETYGETEGGSTGTDTGSGTTGDDGEEAPILVEVRVFEPKPAPR